MWLYITFHTFSHQFIEQKLCQKLLVPRDIAVSKATSTLGPEFAFWGGGAVGRDEWKINSKEITAESAEYGGYNEVSGKMENNWVGGRLQINRTSLKDESETTVCLPRSQAFQREGIASAKAEE